MNNSEIDLHGQRTEYDIKFSSIYSPNNSTNTTPVSGVMFSHNYESDRAAKRKRIQYEMDLDSLKKDKKMYKEENEKLSVEINRQCMMIEKMKYQNENMGKQLHVVTEKYAGEQASLSREIVTLKEARNKIHDERKADNLLATKQIEGLKNALANCEINKEQADSMVTLQANNISELKSQIGTLEAHLSKYRDSQNKLNELQTFKDQYEEDAVVLKMLKQDYKNFPEIHKEYKVLKEKNYNFLLMQEKYEDMKEKNEKLSDTVEKLQSVNAENDDLRHQLNKWKETKADKNLSVDDAMHQLARLQNSEALLTHNQSELQTCVKSLEEQLNKQESENIDLSKKLTFEKGQNSSYEDKIRRMERKYNLIKSERDNYRELLDSYERDVTVVIPASFTQSEEQHAKIIRKMEADYHELEGQLESNQGKLNTALVTIQQLEMKAKQSSVHQRPSDLVSETDRSIITELREQVSDLSKKLEQISAEKEDSQALLDHYHQRGAHDPRTTKVLQFTDNPFTIARQHSANEVERLTEENRRLAERIHILEANKDKVGDLTIQVEQNVQQNSDVATQIKDMEEKLKSAELTNTRLIEVFKKTSRDLRTFICLVTGYEIVVLGERNYKLKHVYAAAPDDCLLFKLQNSRTVQLLENSYSATLSNLTDIYLTHQDSLPAFTSALTQQLFNNRTNTISL